MTAKKTTVKKTVINMKTTAVVILLETCPRCQKGHRITRRSFTSPPLIRPGEKGAPIPSRFYGWAMCPKTKQPILLAWVAGPRLV